MSPTISDDRLGSSPDVSDTAHPQNGHANGDGPLAPETLPAVQPEPIVDAAEAVRWCSLWLVAINAGNVRALIDAQRELRALGIFICLAGGRAAKPIGGGR